MIYPREPKSSEAVVSDEETALRRDAALLRALSTPHKRQKEMKLGKRKKAAPESESGSLDTKRT